MIKEEQYFDFINVEEPCKVKLAGLHFEGNAAVWFLFYMTGRVLVDWKQFINDLVARFENPESMDVQELFNKLRQVSSVGDYEDKFEELRALVVSKNKGFSEEYFVSSFLSGLKDHIKGSVKMFRP